METGTTKIKSYPCGKGAKIVPLPFYILYPIVIGLDIYTTYLGDPKLVMEGNPIIQYFNMGWKTIIVFSSFSTIVTILITYQATIFFEKYYTGKNRNRLIFWIMYFFVIWFYSHFLFESYVPINNYFSYLQNFSIKDSIFYNAALKYVYLTNEMGIYLYHISTVVTAFFCGLWIAFRKIKYFKQLPNN